MSNTKLEDDRIIREYDDLYTHKAKPYFRANYRNPYTLNSRTYEPPPKEEVHMEEDHKQEVPKQEVPNVINRKGYVPRENKFLLNREPKEIKPLNNNLSDAEGLRKAYNHPDRVFIDGNKMYIAGTEPSPLGTVSWDIPKFVKETFNNTKNFVTDWHDNIHYIPFSGYQWSAKYRNAEQILKKNPQVEHLIGHSAGGRAAIDLNANNGNKYKTTTYGAPVGLFSDKLSDDHLRFKGKNDVVGIFDRNAISVNKNAWGPLSNHSFSTGFEDTGKQGGGPNKQIM